MSLQIGSECLTTSKTTDVTTIVRTTVTKVIVKIVAWMQASPTIDSKTWAGIKIAEEGLVVAWQQTIW